MKTLFAIVVVLLCVAVDTGYAQTAKTRTPQPAQPQTPTFTPVVKNGPDMVITNVTGVPDAITSLDPNGECPVFFATITVKNVGNQDAWFPANTWIIGGESQYTNISASQITNSQTQYPRAIKAGESWTATLAGKAKCLRENPAKITFEVDPQKVVAEINESNNTWSKSVANPAVAGLGQTPDLIVQRVWFTPDNPDHYSSIMINLEIKNIGAGPVVFCGYGVIWMSQIEGKNYAAGGAALDGKVILPNEVIGGGVVLADPGELTNGCFRVRVQVDPNNLIAESNENNNSYTAYLSIGGASCQDLITRDQTVKAEIKLQGVPLRTTSTTPMTRVH